jgi:hypothetical protein
MRNGEVVDAEPGEIDEHGVCRYCNHEAPECICSMLTESDAEDDA